MNLYLVERSTESQNAYDTYDSFVVICESEDAARKTHPSNDRLVYQENLGHWEHEVGGPSKYKKNGWIYGDQIYTHLKVSFLGEISHSTEQGLILASYNAG